MNAKDNECAVIPDILDRVNVDGGIVTIDAVRFGKGKLSIKSTRKLAG
ncbi:unnamed protein product [Pararhodospirillum photometricum DSM 122]|uniref:Uncharacterized protein n=1 Tax=Pararhodospirillum photometricum DSM 122 TaxID=1150469 RepID=H6SL67_PARPM|nr:unnamed protein product [Pararhodospirillum photometricum DSM 122]